MTKNMTAKKAHYIPVIGWVIAYRQWVQACRVYKRSGAIPLSKEWEDTFTAYDRTVDAFGCTVGFLMAGILLLKIFHT